MATYDDNVKVQIRISEQTAQGKFNDAIYVTKAEFEAMSDAEIANLKKARVDNWLGVIQEAKTRPAHVPTEAELAEQETSMKRQLEDVQEKLVKVRKEKGK